MIERLEQTPKTIEEAHAVLDGLMDEVLAEIASMSADYERQGFGNGTWMTIRGQEQNAVRYVELQLARAQILNLRHGLDTGKVVL
jgi:hypothetical protein